MMNMRFWCQAWRLRFNLWLARQRGLWQDFADRWRVPPVITNRWFILGAYFLVVLIVGMAWFGRPTLDWQGAKAPSGTRGSGYDIGFLGNPADDVTPAPKEPNRSLAAPGNQTPSSPSADSRPVPTPQVQPQTETSARGGSLPIDHLRYPVEGEVSISNPYTLVSRSVTFKDWRAHQAVDFTATAGTPVRAAAAGTVKQILPSDILWGTVVVLSHGDNCSTTYSSLQDVTVRVGQSVTAGQVIGKLAGSPPAEQLELSHLHFALLDGNAGVDPTELFR